MTVDPRSSFPVPAAWASRAIVDAARYDALCADAPADPDAFWGEQGRRLDWITPFTIVKEASFAMLACTRIGAVHSVVFGGFSPDAIAGRIQDCDSRLVVTDDHPLFRAALKVAAVRAVPDATILAAGTISQGVALLVATINSSPVGQVFKDIVRR